VFSPNNWVFRVTLDSIDIAILNQLQTDSRIPMVELAKRVNLSPTPCVKRVKRLESEGVIRGYHATLDPTALGRSLLVFVQVSLRSTDEATLAAFNQAMRGIPDVLECHMLGGGFDYLVKLRTRDMQDYRHFLGHVLGALDMVETTHTYFVMEEVKESILLPVASPGG